VTVTSQHAKNPAIGWDISAAAKADDGEKIARAQIIINGLIAYDNTFVPPISNWQVQLDQMGQYPGANTVRVIASNDKGEDTESDDSWS
jgi:hypothetical protein